MVQTITCPNCKKEIPLTETIFHQVRESLQKELEAKSRKKEEDLNKREKLLADQVKELEDARKTIEQQVAKRLHAEEEKLKKAAAIEAKSALELEMQDLKEQITTKDQSLRESQENELKLRKKARELEDRQKGLELEVTRKIDQEREKIRQDAITLFTEDHRMKDLEKDKQIEDMRRKIDELKQKAEQGSVHIQGEVMELDLEAILKARFPMDVIEPVPKGMRGADILQNVINMAGQLCGTIIWETKRTRAWSDGWLLKLKDDQREVKAEITVIVSEALPKGITSFANIDGVWVTSPALSGNVAELLRGLLIQVSQATLSSANKGEKMELLYNYLSSPAFRQKVEAIVESFTAMKEDLDKERRAMVKMWAKREKQIEKVVTNTAGMYGDMQGIIGTSLPEIKMLDIETQDTQQEFNDEEIT